MKRTLVYNINTQVTKDNNGYYHSTPKNSSIMESKLLAISEKTIVSYVSRIAEDRRKQAYRVALFELNHNKPDYFVIIVNDISSLQQNVKMSYTALRTANNLGVKTYIYDNETGIRVFIPPYKRDELTTLLKQAYELFQENKAYEFCKVEYTRLSTQAKQLMDITGITEIPVGYKEYVNRNANAYDISLPKTHYQTVDNVYKREGTERGARNTIGHCIGVTFNQILEREPDYILDEQYLIAYLTIRYYQQNGITPTSEYVLCPECAKHGKIEYIKRTHTGEPNFCKLCGTKVESFEFSSKSLDF